MFSFFASCPKGIELLLEQEVLDFGAKINRRTVAGVYIEGELELAYKLCLWSRLANRLILNLFNKPIENAQTLYEAFYNYEWEQHFSNESSIAVDFIGTNDQIKNYLY